MNECYEVRCHFLLIRDSVCAGATEGEALPAPCIYQGWAIGGAKLAGFQNGRGQTFSTPIMVELGWYYFRCVLDIGMCNIFKCFMFECMIVPLEGRVHV